jgi:peptidoglycan hydrolase-like protein with peptidoglycan-binding domain
MATASAANAQMTAPSTAGAKPKPVATVPIRPDGQAPANTSNVMVQAERLALQSDLAWSGHYNGVITGDVSERMVNAIKEFQKANGGKPTGVLNPQERAVLAETARRKQESVGWKIVTEPATGARLGIPGKLVPQLASDANGAKWTSPTGTVQVLLSRRKETNPTTARLADQEKKPAERKVEYSAVKPDFFVLSGLQGQKKFYVRGTFKGDEVRVMTILYDQATAAAVDPVVIAMSSAFNPFPSAAQAGAPPPRKNVEYATGVVVSEDGAIVTGREVTDACLTIAIAGYGNADRVAEDREHDLALLRIYGARGLKALNLASGVARSAVDIIGIADPQNQGGGAAVTGIKAVAAAVAGSGELALSPPPSVGFSGAAVIDRDGKFAGIALLKPVTVVGPANSVQTSQAVMVSADIVSSFLKAHGVTPDGTADAKASVLRVICVRK